MLSPAEHSSYRQQGYLQLPSFLDHNWIDRLRAASDHFVTQSRSLTTSSTMLDLEPDHSPDNPRLRRLVSPVDHHEVFRELAFEGPIAELAIELLGDPVRFHHGKLNYKWSEGGEAVKWHQDIQFWPHTDFSPLTIGVYLDDVDDSMGPMGVFPGSHLGPLYDQYDHDGNWAGALKDEDASELDTDEVSWLKGPAGSVTVHNCCMIHGSMPNNSSRPRRLLLQTYSAGDSYPVSGIGANGRLGGSGGTIIGRAPNQNLTIDGRSMHGAPDWSKSHAPTIFGSQQQRRGQSQVPE
ncbi:MAG: phytanoyl-CoA dioxygenase family protein [Pseudomonadota bacterium]